jgi:hypothetical protein
MLFLLVNFGILLIRLLYDEKLFKKGASYG